VQTLLDERIVARSGELKERALRRRASRIVGKLAAQAAAEADRQRLGDEERAARARAVGQLAGKIERRQDALSEQLATSLGPAAQAWQEDLALVFVGRDREAASRDPVLARYRVERAVAALAPALSRALASLAAESGLSPAEMLPAARTLVRAAAAASPPDAEPPLLALSRAAVATLVDQLFALSVAPVPSTRAAGLVRELTALATALE
jgi:hypothetical protein